MARGSKPGEYRGGRKKGTPNRDTQRLIGLLVKEGFDTAARLVKMIDKAEREFDRHEEIHDAIQANRDDQRIKGYVQDNGPQYLAMGIRGCVDLMKFEYPQRKAVDITTGGENLSSTFAEAMRIAIEKRNAAIKR